MISRFFIDRPVFAAVVAILMMLIGGVSVMVLPVEQYPEIAPPVVQVTTAYPGADAQTLVDTVTAPLEQAINGTEGMIYMRSTSTSEGTVTIDVTFELGTDPDLASVYTQNSVSTAEPRLPPEVTRQGVQTQKRSTSLLMVVSVIAKTGPDGEPLNPDLDDLYLSNYTEIYIRDRLARVPGVGEVFIFGGKPFAMRIWIDPEKLATRDLTTVDLLEALRSQNIQVSGGQIGQEPTPNDNGFQYTVTTQGRLDSAEQFADIVVKVGEDQRVVRVGDVARVELSSQSYSGNAEVNGRPASTMGIYQLPGSNAVAVADGVTAALEELAERFPPDIDYQITFNYTDFVKASISEVITTLFIASALVFLVTLVFLQDWRATLVPTVTIPVSLLATFGVLLAFGYSLNMLTLFGLILAIGIVVDDAIVVVENTARNIDEKNLGAKEAARQAMDEVGGALIATTLVVLAVFIPAALLGGLTGVLYRQFAITIAVATCFSTLNALTLSPALCGLLLRPSRKTRFAPFKWFNQTLDGSRGGYLWLVTRGVRFSAVVVLLFVGIVVATGLIYQRTPTGFIPPDDQGFFFINIQLPDAAKLARTDAVLDQVEAAAMSIPGVTDVVSVSGFSLLTGAQASNYGLGVVVLDDWAQRPPVGDVIAELSEDFANIPEAIIFAFPPPPIQGLGSSGGFQYQLQDQSDAGVAALQDAADTLINAAEDDPELTRMFSGFRARVPQLYVDIDRVQAQKLGVPMGVVFDTLSTNLGSSYVNDFNYFGRVFRVYAQAEAQFRGEPEDITLLKVRNNNGDTLPLDAVATVQDTVGPAAIVRYNLFPSASISGEAAPGLSSGAAIAKMTELSASILPAGFGFEWTGQTYQELKAGSQAPIAFAMGLLVVFLVLAAQYESWTTPISILLTVPLGVFGALLGVNAMGLDNNIYTQVGFVLLIALVAKNAILIVEFARDLRLNQGRSIRDAALEAAKLRFRPILMTAFSFVLGTVPLVVATGAGAASRQSLGTAVFFGMLLATVVGVVFVPVFFYLIQSTSEKLGGGPPAAAAQSPSPGSPAPEPSAPENPETEGPADAKKDDEISSE
ncbi:MAG: multidrug efflux RND transporter permease subunit [Planctomycetota bacterium]